MLGSWVLVAAQFALIGLLIVTTRPSTAATAVALAGVFAIAAAAVGIAALAANRPGNFNIRPEPKDRARLVTHG
ncbi:MAG: hypothetical protein N3D71_10045, partial [Burkholderiaceae bacterium]|nr:hypothetical protein [Burkholderiaceae bacterium]